MLPWTRRCCSSSETQGAAQFARHCRRGDRVRRWESAAGTKRQFAAAQRCGSYQRRTRRSAAALNPRRARREERCHAASRLKGLWRRNETLTGRHYPTAAPAHDRVDFPQSRHRVAARRPPLPIRTFQDGRPTNNLTDRPALNGAGFRLRHRHLSGQAPFILDGYRPRPWRCGILLRRQRDYMCGCGSFLSSAVRRLGTRRCCGSGDLWTCWALSIASRSDLEATQLASLESSA